MRCEQAGAKVTCLENKPLIALLESSKDVGTIGTLAFHGLKILQIADETGAFQEGDGLSELLGAKDNQRRHSRLCWMSLWLPEIHHSSGCDVVS